MALEHDKKVILTLGFEGLREAIEARQVSLAAANLDQLDEMIEEDAAETSIYKDGMINNKKTYPLIMKMNHQYARLRAPETLWAEEINGALINESYEVAMQLTMKWKKEVEEAYDSLIQITQEYVRICDQ